MKYLRRSLKYFIQVSLLLSVILLALMATGLISRDINVAFTGGWKSVGYIALMFAGVSAIYPLFGYSRRTVAVNGDPQDLRGGVVEAFRSRGYDLEREQDGILSFRLSSPVNRISRMGEDRITVTPVFGGFELEGLTRDLARAVAALENRFRDYGN